MILRLVRGRVKSDRLSQLRRGLAEAYFPYVSGLDGLVSTHVGIRETPDGHEAAFATTWDAPDAVMAVFGPDVQRIRPLAGVSEHLDIGQPDHFEVDEALLLRRDARPSTLRIAIGSIDQGADAEIQQDIRRRLPDLDGDLAEAAVARRLLDRGVEVLLMTLWSTVHERFGDLGGHFDAMGHLLVRYTASKGKRTSAGKGHGKLSAEEIVVKLNALVRAPLGKQLNYRSIQNKRPTKQSASKK